jgi:cation diffusion facilitator CzcD-associated flavoprotein CzcO
MTSEYFDVLIVGAGLSGIGAAYRLQTECPGQTYAILEGRESIGGTWDLFRFPGVRSDSDMFTLGYPFRPWQQANSIADGQSILTYIRQTAEAYGIDRKIRYRQKVVSADWDSSRGRWTVEVDSGAAYTCRFLYMCSGYYSYEGGYRPEFPGSDQFRGRIVHPQEWPSDLDYAGKRVVIIGSGATAVTLLPAMADRAAHVTMLQRSPSYIASLPAVDPITGLVRRYVPSRLAPHVNRWKNVILTLGFYQFCRRFPAQAKKFLAEATAKQLPEGYPVDPDFTPRYNPWDQRMCLVPDGDLFEAIKAGRASVVTDRIDAFTETGIRLESGRQLEADVIVTATGLELLACGGIRPSVDGREVDPHSTHVYRGFMLSDVPNFAICLGYTNASWTLRADLASKSVCRLINLMARDRFDVAVVRYPETDEGSDRPLLDLNSGYILRSASRLPKQGARPPWRLRQNYLLDYFSSRFGDLSAGVEFSRLNPQQEEVSASA